MTRVSASGLTVLGLLGGVCLSGCQAPVAPAGRDAMVRAEPEQAPKLNDRQVADLKFALGRSLERGGDTGAAANAYREAVLKDAARADACWRLAILCDRAAKFPESEDWYRKALAGLPGNADIFCDIGYSFYLQKRWEEAEMNLRQAIALAPEHARAHNNLGLVLAHTDRPDQALAAFRRAGSSEADCHVNLACALVMENSLAEARRHYGLALAEDAASAPARKGLRELDMLVARSAPADPGDTKLQAAQNSDSADR